MFFKFGRPSQMHSFYKQLESLVTSCLDLFTTLLAEYLYANVWPLA